jgi:putative membrane protein
MTGPTPIQLLGSHWSPDPTLDLEAAVIAGSYLLGAIRVRGRWPALRSLSFLVGIACLLLALQSGLDRFDDELLSVHMLQHMLLLMVAPPLLIAGRPLILLLRALAPHQRRLIGRALRRTRPWTKPWVCLAVFCAAMIGTHVPWFYDATLRHPALHEFEHALYVIAGLLLFWPLLEGDPAQSYRFGGVARLIYMLAAMVPMAVIGAYLNRHPTLVYHPYAVPARALGVSALQDQAQAGAIMWVVGNTIMVVIGLGAVLQALIADERRHRTRDVRPVAIPGPDSGGRR